MTIMPLMMILMVVAVLPTSRSRGNSPAFLALLRRTWLVTKGIVDTGRVQPHGLLEFRD